MTIDQNAPSTKKIRDLSSDQYANRPVRIEHHYHDRYGDRYDYYRHQPPIYIGGGYSSLFWYSMMDWNYERRALWLYHHQGVIDSQIYAQQLQNEQLRLEIERLKTQNVSIDNSYVDNEFVGNEDLMYDDEHVEAAYNPTPVSAPVAAPTAATSSGWGVLCALVSVVGVGLVIALVVYLVFIKDWKVEE